MTTFCVAMLVVACIVLIARYHKSVNLASNLLLTLAFSVAVGLGIQFSTKNYSKVKKEVTTEKFVNTTDSASMQSVAALEPAMFSQSGVAGKTQNWLVKTSLEKDKPTNKPLHSLKIGPPAILDSS